MHPTYVGSTVRNDLTSHAWEKNKNNLRIGSKVEEEFQESKAHNKSRFAERVELFCEDTDWIVR